MTEPVAIAVFAKAPVPGYAKTRLIPALGPEAAAELQGRFIARTVATALAAGLGPVTLWCAPDCTHPAFAALRGRVALRPQAEGDLGARMAAAFEAAPAPLLLLGTDCPILTADHLRSCATALRDHDAVFLPVEDGGYVLVGLHRPVPELFAGMTWSTPTVMAETRARLRGLGLSWAEPAILWDVDEISDLDRCRALGLA